jgi:hypothetical protein
MLPTVLHRVYNTGMVGFKTAGKIYYYTHT